MNIGDVENTFRGYLDEIAADLNYFFMPFWSSILSWVFRNIYEGLDVDQEFLEKIRPIIGNQVVVFVPNHRSHMDYLLLAYVLHHNSIPVPFVAAGSNLSFWPLGWLFRKSSAFFIRRSYEGNKLYAAAVQAYIEELVYEKSCLEFFIEGTRSRTGKLLSPRMGILTTLMRAHKRLPDEDILLVPTSFTYESVVEEKSYSAEKAGAAKKDEGFWDLFRIRKHLGQSRGKVYIRFGEIISMKNYLESPEISALDARTQTQRLAHELTYGINRSTLITPAAIAATALLSHEHRALSEKQTQDMVDIYLDYLHFKGSPLSDILEKYRQPAIREALRDALDQNLIHERRDPTTDLVYYHVPEEKRPLLDYYKNNSIHFFISLSALSALLRYAPGGRISKTDLIRDYLLLQKIFEYEFTYSRRQSLENHLEKLFEFLVQKNLALLSGDVLQIPESAHERLALYAAPLRNYFEAYLLVWQFLPSLGGHHWEEQRLLTALQDSGHLSYWKEEISRPEAVNRFTMRNALKAFCDLGLLKQETETWGKKKTHYFLPDAASTTSEQAHSLVTLMTTLSKSC